MSKDEGQSSSKYHPLPVTTGSGAKVVNVAASQVLEFLSMPHALRCSAASKAFLSASLASVKFASWQGIQPDDYWRGEAGTTILDAPALASQGLLGTPCVDVRAAGDAVDDKALLGLLRRAFRANGPDTSPRSPGRALSVDGIPSETVGVGSREHTESGQEPLEKARETTGTARDDRTRAPILRGLAISSKALSDEVRNKGCEQGHPRANRGVPLFLLVHSYVGTHVLPWMLAVENSVPRLHFRNGLGMRHETRCTRHDRESMRARPRETSHVALSNLAYTEKSNAGCRAITELSGGRVRDVSSLRGVETPEVGSTRRKAETTRLVLRTNMRGTRRIFKCHGRGTLLGQRFFLVCPPLLFLTGRIMHQASIVSVSPVPTNRVRVSWGGAVARGFWLGLRLSLGARFRASR